MNGGLGLLHDAMRVTSSVRRVNGGVRGRNMIRFRLAIATVAFWSIFLENLALAGPCDGVSLAGNYQWIALDGQMTHDAPASVTIAGPRPDGALELSGRGSAELRVIGKDCRLVLRPSESELISYRVEYASEQGDLVLSSDYGSVVLKRVL